MEQQYESLVRGLIADGHEVSLVTTRGASDTGSLPAYSNIWHASGGNGRYSLNWWLSTANRRGCWRDENWDLVLSISFAGGMASFWRGCTPVVAQIHGTALAEVQSSGRSRTVRELLKVALNGARILREKVFLPRFDRVIAISDAVEGQLRGFPYFLSRDRVSVVPNGVAEVEADNIQSRREAKRSALGISDDEVIFLFSGRLHPQKGLSDALSAFNKTPTGRLLIAGAGVGQGEAEAAALENPRIIVLGRVPHEDLGEVYAAADVLIFPSRRKEGLPMVLLESAAFGLPALVYDGCGVPGDLFSGMTLVPANVGQLASHMLAALPRRDMNPLLPERFSLTNMIQRYEECFDAARLRAK